MTECFHLEPPLVVPPHSRATLHIEGDKYVAFIYDAAGVRVGVKKGRRGSGAHRRNE